MITMQQGYLHLVAISWTAHTQNDQEKLDHLPGYTFGKDDESKWAIEGEIGFYLNLR